MKVLVMTRTSIYGDFLNSVVEEHKADHEIYVVDEHKYISDFVHYDVGISFMYRHKVPKEELNKATWFNFHPAPLPEYKGRNLCYHAIMNGEKSFGATVHYMDEGFDTGDIIEVTKFKLPSWWTAGRLSKWTIEASKTLFEKYFPRIIAGEQFERFPNVGGTYYKKQEIEDTMPLNDVPLERWIRAVTYGSFYPKIDIGGVVYKIVRDE